MVGLVSRGFAALFNLYIVVPHRSRSGGAHIPSEVQIQANEIVVIRIDGHVAVGRQRAYTRYCTIHACSRIYTKTGRKRIVVALHFCRYRVIRP